MSENRFRILFFMLLAVLSLTATATHAQLSPDLYSYPQNHLPWYTISTPNFEVHFQKENSRSAQLAARIGEQIYPSITSLYNHEPDSKTDIVLKDRQDYSNGAAYFFDNHIDIWVSPLKSSLRGTHDWLWDVITHEFTHIVQLETAMKKSRRLPAIYFQWLSYSNVRRPDVLYGFPKGIITYPFSSVNVPAWFAEGVAQYQRQKFYYDYWDSHRDMLLRTALLADNPIPFDEMSFFTSKNVLERERIYNQGFAFSSYFANRFGESIIPAISDSLSQSGLFTIDKAMNQATGIQATKLFGQFLDSTKSAYQSAIDSLSTAPTNDVQTKGFYNFYPKLSHSENKLAYLSNKAFQSRGVQLYVQDLEKPQTMTQKIDLGQYESPKNRKAYSQKPLIKRLQSSYSFSDDDQQIAYSKQKLNKVGERYNDLYLYDLEGSHSKMITHNQRLSSPDWNPNGQSLAAIQQSRGTDNLVEVDVTSGSIQQLTHFTSGQEVFTPAWGNSGQHIYFSASHDYARDIYRYDYQSDSVKAILQDTLTNYRDPSVGTGGEYLYYAADPDGIFNIYRIPLNQPAPSPEQLTSVLGGAFMPSVSGDSLYFAEFKASGYQISSLSLTGTTKTISSDNAQKSYKLPKDGGLKFASKKDIHQQTNFRNITPLSPAKLEQLGPSDSLTVDTQNPDSKEPLKLRRYKSNFTSISFYPVIRFDNYTKKNGSNGHLLTTGHFGELGENLLRDMKIGTYISSRDVTDQLSIFGGAMFGLASKPADGVGSFFAPSRLTDLDRDLFLIAEYNGLPFIEKRWSPTISLEFYNQRRNVADGLSIQEFPCTSCLPKTTNADIAYNIWEADVYLRSKINRRNILELGLRYSPYKVQTDGFFSKELKQFVPASSSTYFKGTTLTAAYVFEDYLPYPNSDVAPLGIRTSLRYNYEPNKLLNDYKIDNGTLSPVYNSVKNHSLETTIRYGFPASDHTAINLYGRGFSYLNRPDDSFYLDYIGGFSGMRSYPYFALGGSTTAYLKLSYTFPLLRNIHQQVGRHTFDKLYFQLFAEAGNGWRSSMNTGDNIKSGLGGELRFAFNSYYQFPIKLFVSGAYGFNKFDITLPQDFVTTNSNQQVSYGQNVIFHFGLTFDFNVFNRGY